MRRGVGGNLKRVLFSSSFIFSFIFIYSFSIFSHFSLVKTRQELFREEEEGGCR